jgi:two-component system alkaline phosphatase synthesis response regulator PhoP
MPMRILLVEDEELIGRMVELNLKHEGYEITWVKNGTDAEARALAEPWDLLVLDVMLPGSSGFQVAKTLRERDVTMPILMLTARGDTTSKVRGLDSGADDYMVKPFDMAELLARVRALIRRSQGTRHLPSTQVIRFGRYEVNLETSEAVTNLGRVMLTEKEAKLMALFARHRGETLSRADILEEVWGMDANPTERTIDNIIVRLRRYFESDPESPAHIVSVRGQGYRFNG